MSGILWKLKYAWLLLRSPYEVTLRGAWREACASWEMNQDERGPEPMMTPAEALYEDQRNWRDAW